MPGVQLQWSGALANSGAVAALLNLETTPKQLNLQKKELPPSRVNQGSWTITEAFSGQVLCKGCSLPQTVEVAPHDVALLILSPTVAV